MKLSELETVLADLRGQIGDVEVNEALPEYGWKPITEESVGCLIRVETSQARGEATTQELVIGRH